MDPGLVVKLAELAGAGAPLHAVYPLLAATDDCPGELERARAHILGLQAQAACREMREACQWMLAALASLETLPARPSAALLAAEMQRDEKVRSDPATPPRERRILLLRGQLLQRRWLGLTRGDDAPVPRIVHLVRTDAADDDLPLLQYLCYRSILAHCRGYRILLHAPAMPRGARWQALLGGMELCVGVPPQFLGAARLLGAAHQSDVWRLQALIAHGGFYFDWDVLLLRGPDHLRGEVCVMALERQEAGYHEVLGVAAIGAGPGSRFLAAWLEAMPRAFDPRHYVAHSTLLARQLALDLPMLVRVLDYRAFYDPGWTDAAARWLFDPAESLPEEALRERLGASTGIHLFASHPNIVRFSAHLTERDIAAPRCNLARLLQPYL